MINFRCRPLRLRPPLGAEANKFVFTNADAFSWQQTFESLALVDEPTALIVSDGDDSAPAQ